MKIEVNENELKLILKLLELSDPLNIFTVNLRQNIINQVNGDIKIVEKGKDPKNQ